MMMMMKRRTDLEQILTVGANFDFIVLFFSNRSQIKSRFDLPKFCASMNQIMILLQTISFCSILHLLEKINHEVRK